MLMSNYCLKFVSLRQIKETPMYWEQKSTEMVKSEVLNALAHNRNYRSSAVLGLPASYLDPEVFPPDAAFLEDAPFAKVFMENPNHIGCHTLVGGESAFGGTHALERDLIRICAEEMMDAPAGGYDGYVASGGTEANIQAMWIFRNMFMEQYGIGSQHIGIIYSSDSHYSFYKAGNLLQIKTFEVEVAQESRQMSVDAYAAAIRRAQAAGVRCLVGVFNMGTTMFGSVDDICSLLPVLKASGMPYKVHVDGAFGGFVYPFSNQEHAMTFKNPEVSSMTIDAHKMLQAPYGTGIFMARKGLMEFTHTGAASYVLGGDSTLSGSRSGANLVAAWMILNTHGSDGWRTKISALLSLTDELCNILDLMGIVYYRNPEMNLVTMRADQIPAALAEKYLLVPDSHGDQAHWYKIVVMDHVKPAILRSFIEDLQAACAPMA
jgi:tyrosine decarboxylase/aspartate 1-decarboxylase